jgi:hypothetical protein
MKIGIVFRGITSGKSPTQKKDWTLARDNIKENLIDSFPNPYIYFTTYQHEVLPEVIDFYKPNDVKLVDYNSSNQRQTLFDSIKNIIDINLDFIIVARFDIEYKQKFSSLNINYNKFNFIFKEIEPHWTNDKFVSDTVFAFPRRYAVSFMEAVQAEIIKPIRPYSDMHNAYNRLYPIIGNENIHFMVDGTHRSDSNDYFEIKRIPK